MTEPVARMTARAERRAMIALFAVFALLVQALVPAVASAATARPGEPQVICTGHGLATIHTGDAAPAKGAVPGHCEHCVCPPATLAATASAEPAVAVAYAVVAQPEASAADLPPAARAPPRPPGQGPPASDA